jgi:transitional endoplasmic reticulum ATPase
MVGTKAKLTLTVENATDKDRGRGLVRVDAVSMRELDASIGDVISVSFNGKQTVARCLPLFEPNALQKIYMDRVLRDNAGVKIGEKVKVEKINPQPAHSASLRALTPGAAQLKVSEVLEALEGRAAVAGDLIELKFQGLSPVQFKIESTVPGGPVVFSSSSVISLQSPAPSARQAGSATKHRTSYEDVGGLANELSRIREMIELPLKMPEAFSRLGIEPPKGVLLNGPPGSGKTLIARAIANAANANFMMINGPEIIQKFYGESEANLRSIFDEASKKAPSIIFIDEIDAIAPKRSETQGDVEKRVVAQLLALMDGLQSRGQVIVIGATNLPDALDPALRRPGRFDREILIPAPDKAGRLEILHIHTRTMPLSRDVNLEQLASITHGFVGADLQSLCREAGMTAIRALIAGADGNDSIPYEQLMQLEVTMAHFLAALRDVEPSALRDILVEVPDIRFEDIGGLAELKQILKESIDWPLRYPQLFAEAKAKPPKGILLCGPPGTGKTMLAKALASQSEANFISIKGPSLYSKWVGETEKGVRELFRKARQVAPTIVFIDEIDSLAPRRTSTASDSGVAERATSQLLTELDGLEELRGVVVVAATNRRDMIDPALIRPGRFDLIVDLPIPDEEARMEILKIHTRGRPLAPEVDLRQLNKEFEGSVGAEIETVVNRACIFAIRDFLDSGMKEKLQVRLDDFRRALEFKSKVSKGEE